MYLYNISNGNIGSHTLCISTQSVMWKPESTVHSGEDDNHWEDHPCSTELLLGTLVKVTRFWISSIGQWVKILGEDNTFYDRFHPVSLRHFWGVQITHLQGDSLDPVHGWILTTKTGVKWQGLSRITGYIKHKIAVILVVVRQG